MSQIYDFDWPAKIDIAAQQRMFDQIAQHISNGGDLLGTAKNADNGRYEIHFSAALSAEDQTKLTALYTEMVRPMKNPQPHTCCLTVAELSAYALEGEQAYATDGRKDGETAGNGTGVPVYYSNGAWRVFRDDTQVQA